MGLHDNSTTDLPLSQSENLADLLSPSTARVNLGLGNVEDVALSTWVGSVNLSTLGTITTGEWNGTNISVGFGGTGTTTTFATGSIVFAGTSGVYSENSTQLFWDNTNNRLGIGTNVPTDTLQIGAGGGSASMNFNGGGGLGSVLSVHQKANPATNPMIMDVYNYDYSKLLFRILDTGTSGYINLGGGLNVNQYNNHVELGYFSNVFGAVLGIRADATSQDTVMMLSLAGTGNHAFGYTSNEPYIYMQNTSYVTAVKINSSGDSWFNGGNVGIGTLSPVAKLQVVGGSSQGVYSTSTNDIAVNAVGTGSSSYGVKGESDTGTALRANITNTSGIGLDVNYTPTNATLLKVLANGQVLMPNLPTSAAGLPSGALWNNSGVVNIV